MIIEFIRGIWEIIKIILSAIFIIGLIYIFFLPFYERHKGKIKEWWKWQI